MRKFWTLFMCLMAAFVISQAQPTDLLAKEDVPEEGEEIVEGWTKGGTGTLNFNQAHFKNWAAGGENSLSLLALLTYHTKYRKDKHLWFAQVWGEYGTQYIFQDKEFRKNADRIELLTKYGYKISSKWYFATLLNTRSQFTKSFNYDDDREDIVERGDLFISRFASPLIIEYSVGFDFVPNEVFSLYLSPLAAKFTAVRDQGIKETYGVTLTDRARKELGALAIANYNQKVHENVQINSVLKVYKDYLNMKNDDANGRAINPGKNIDVDWQTTIGLKVTKYLTASIFTHLIWDYNTDVLPDDDTRVDPDDPTSAFLNPETIGHQEKVQFRDVIGIGLSFNF